MPVCQVIKKFGSYNAGEKINATPAQVKSWVNRGVVVAVPDGIVERKTVAAPPVDKMMEVADEAKADDVVQDDEMAPKRVYRRGRRG